MASILQTLGQHLIVGLSATELLPVEERLLKELSPLGIIFFSKNFEKTEDNSWTRAFFDLLKRVKDLSGREDLIVSIDHEGGRVHRFPSTVVRFAAARKWEEHAFEVGKAMGAELAALGFTLSFAPVLDIHSEENNPVIGERALSTDPIEVATRGVAVFQGLEASGIVACGKHFPGHGATLQDSHFELPKLEIEVDTIIERELIPFQGLIHAGIPMMMSAHVLYPALDPAMPATLSGPILSGILRDELGFDGIVVTDDLEMKALHEYTAGQKAVMALAAGNDILLEANPSEGTALETAYEMLSATAEAVELGQLDLTESQQRIERFRAYHAMLASTRNERLFNLNVLGASTHLELAGRLEQRIIKVEPL